MKPLFLVIIRLIGLSFACHSFTPQYATPTYSNSYYSNAHYRAAGQAQTGDVAPVNLNDAQSPYPYQPNCGQYQYPAYSALDLKSQAALTPLDTETLSTDAGGRISCTFDENPPDLCSWSNANETTLKFWKAEYGRNFDRQRFNCTSPRKFAFDGKFLIAGNEPGPANTQALQTAAIQTTIPCQLGDATLKFDAWATSDSPNIRWCIAQAQIGLICRDIIVDRTSPLNFSIPQSDVPMVIRIEVTHIGVNDIIVLDNLYYDGQICQIVPEDEFSTEPTEELESFPPSGNSMNSFGLPQKIDSSETSTLNQESLDEASAASPRPLFSMKIHKIGEEMVISTNNNSTETSSPTTPSIEDYKEQEEFFGKEEEEKEFPTTSLPDKVNTEFMDAGPKLVVDVDNNSENPRSFPISPVDEFSNDHFKARQASQAPPLDSILPVDTSAVGEVDPCLALTCTFNDEHPCFYGLSGIGSTSPWIHTNKLVGNRHTGIQRINIGDQERVGYVYVGKNHIDQSLDTFVMESPKFVIKRNLFLVFDVYIRSYGPKLKVCIDSFDLCPYISPKINKKTYWHEDQRVFIQPGSKKIYFMAEDIRKNLFIAVDNIRLQTEDGQDFCSLLPP